MADRRSLTDRYLRALASAPPGERDEVWDIRVPGFGIRISDTEDANPARRGKAGKITFILFTRFSPGAAPTRRVIGVYGAITLEEARRTAGEWRSLVAKSIDPAVVEAEAREKAARERALRIRHSFANVAEAFIAASAPIITARKQGQRQGRPVATRPDSSCASPASIDKRLQDSDLRPGIARELRKHVTILERGIAELELA